MGDPVLVERRDGVAWCTLDRPPLNLRDPYTDLAAAIDYGIDAFATAYAGDEPREGTRAFLEKRAPRFGSRS